MSYQNRLPLGKEQLPLEGFFMKKTMRKHNSKYHRVPIEMGETREYTVQQNASGEFYIQQPLPKALYNLKIGQQVRVTFTEDGPVVQVYPSNKEDR